MKKEEDKMEIRHKKYLVVAIINNEVDYKIVHNPDVLDSKQDDFFCDYGHPRKPDYIIELPTSPRGLELILKKLNIK